MMVYYIVSIRHFLTLLREVRVRVREEALDVVPAQHDALGAVLQILAVTWKPVAVLETMSTLHSVKKTLFETT